MTITDYPAAYEVLTHTATFTLTIENQLCSTPEGCTDSRCIILTGSIEAATVDTFEEKIFVFLLKAPPGCANVVTFTTSLTGNHYDLVASLANGTNDLEETTKTIKIHDGNILA